MEYFRGGIDTSQLSSSQKQQQQQHPNKKKGRLDLKDLRGLQDCVQFINQWAQQVEHVCKRSKVEPQNVPSLEQCRTLILHWAQELKRVDIDTNLCYQDQVRNTEDLEPSAQPDNTIMEWAEEFQTLTTKCGVMVKDLPQMLRQFELDKRLGNLLSFLEFITWSLLKKDSPGIVPQLWLANKQRTWKTETPMYIPNTVWEWIWSASVNVSLDPMTNHPWLLLSDDRKKVQESHCPTEVVLSTQRFDGWPCVLGWEGFSSGCHYWEVTLANKGYWRVGVTTASSKRHGRFPMIPAEGYWALWRSTRQFYACTKPETALPLSLTPNRMGVYLDYEEGQLSFYNAETRAHIYTFACQFKEKLYPLFAPLDGRTLMTLASPECA
ncbi:butyrophilin subfamily 1 member A1-like [Aplochiton taeniatus]